MISKSLRFGSLSRGISGLKTSSLGCFFVPENNFARLFLHFEKPPPHRKISGPRSLTLRSFFLPEGCCAERRPLSRSMMCTLSPCFPKGPPKNPPKKALARFTWKVVRRNSLGFLQIEEGIALCASCHALQWRLGLT